MLARRFQTNILLPVANWVKKAVQTKWRAARTIATACKGFQQGLNRVIDNVGVQLNGLEIGTSDFLLEKVKKKLKKTYNAH